ncbi:MFS transporter [uncultured Gilvimarinus sp.]|uniref:MFS transporter n=1 Tax=uncultured Gilvimarinus sp. TaxID=1689143 RepID=UPI0030D6D3D0
MNTNSPTLDKIASPWLVLVTVCLGAFVAPLGMASVNVAIPALAEDLAANAVLVSWIPTVVLISNIMFMLPAGKCADLWGRKRLFFLGVCVNAGTSAVAFFAQSIEVVLLLRFIQGIGSAMMFATSMALLISVFPADKRGLPLGLNAACIYLGLTLAPALGGWVTEALGWRYVFLLPLPIATVVLGILMRVPGEWHSHTKDRFDWRGAVLFAAVAVCLAVGLAGLPDIENAALVVIALVLLAVFVRMQARAKAPLIRVQMFRESKLFSMSLATASLMYASSYPLGFMLSLYLQYVRGYSAGDAGQILLVQALTMAFVAPIAGRLSDFFPARWLASAGCACTLAGFALLSTLDSTTERLDIMLALLLVGFGFGFFSSPNNHVVMHSAQAHEVGVAAATLNLARVMGNLVGMSLVNLFVHWHLGDSAMSRAIAEPLLLTFHQAINLAMGFLLLATVLSLLRGRAHAAATSV